MDKLNESELVNWMKLTRVPKLGPRKIKDLFEIFGDINKIISASNSELIRTRIFNEPMIQEWDKLKEASDDNFFKVIRECNEANIQILTLLDKDYPKKLKMVPYPPLTLFLKGNLSLLEGRKLAIVGSRKAEEKARKWTYENAKELAEVGITIVSGGAIGIDTAAHKGALDISNGKTICVLGSGFSRMFPEENFTLFKEIEKRGLLISEHLPNFPGSRFSLIQRNRITSGLSDALIIAASGKMGGAMVQTKIAYEQRVPIFCPRLSLNMLPNEGLNQVIEDWGGKEITNAKEVLDLVKDLKVNASEEKQERLVLFA